MLFLVVFFWTPPHTWALALRYREDYAAVDVPMLPVVAPAARRSAGRSSLYTLGDGRDLAAAVAGRRHRRGSTRSPRPCSGAAFLVEAHRMWRRTRGTEDLAVIRPMRLFHSSNLYLSLLFVAVALDPLLTR